MVADDVSRVSQRYSQHTEATSNFLLKEIYHSWRVSLQHGSDIFPVQFRSILGSMDFVIAAVLLSQ